MNSYFGKYRGKVIDNKDPQQLGQLLVTVPDVLGEVQLWALPCVPYAGKQVGLFVLPPKNANIWVEFEAGNPQYPIWSGCFWGSGEMPVSPAVPETKVFKTEGCTLTINAGATKAVTLEVGKPIVDHALKMSFSADGILLSNSNKAVVKMTDAAITLSIGTSQLTLVKDKLELKNGGNVAEVTSKSVDLKSGPANVGLSSSGIDLKTGTSTVKVSTVSVSINGGALEVF
jgi:hypothetical protein